MRKGLGGSDPPNQASDDAIAKANALAQNGLFPRYLERAAILARLRENRYRKCALKGLRYYWLCRPDGGIKYMSMGIYGK
jgi:hypothetical protein